MAHGHQDWCLNAGGDVLVSGTQASGQPWTVGIVDPDDRSRLWTQIDTHPGRMAVATSGVQERGEHVWRMVSETTFTQVTVAAADIETADVLATAILGGGIATLELGRADGGLLIERSVFHGQGHGRQRLGPRQCLQPDGALVLPLRRRTGCASPIFSA